MRKILIFLSLLVANLLSAQDSAFRSIFWKPVALYKSARVARESVYAFTRKEDGTTDTLLIQQKDYDGNGNLTRQVDFERGVPKLETTHFFSANRMDSSLEQQRGARQGVKRYVYTYDAAGRLATKKTVSADTATIHERYRYSSDGRLQAIYRVNKKGEEVLHARYKYTADGFLERIEFLSREDWRDVFTLEYKYNRKKAAVTRRVLRPFGAPQFDDYSLVFDERGRLFKKMLPDQVSVSQDLGNLRVNHWTEEQLCFYHPDGLLHRVLVKRNGLLHQTLEYHYSKR